MMRWYGLAALLAALTLTGLPASAQVSISETARGPREEMPDPKPVYNYELKAEHGAFLVCVRTFKGKFAQDPDPTTKKLAEDFAAYIRDELRLWAYVHERGWQVRQDRKKERAAVIEATIKEFRKRGEEPPPLDKFRMVRCPDEYVVLVAPGNRKLKTLDEAVDFAKYVRALKTPPAAFCEVVTVSATGRGNGEPINPFTLAIPGPNPLAPKAQVDFKRPMADELMERTNAGQPHSLIHNTKKPWTLIVKSYGGNFGQVVKASDVGRDVARTSAPSTGEILERAAQQANEVVAGLRKFKPPIEAYVLHGRYESFICIGQYDSADDPNLLANIKAFANFNIHKGDPSKNLAPDYFMEKPMPAMIPMRK